MNVHCHLTRGIFGPHESAVLNAISIASSVFAGLTGMPNTQTTEHKRAS